MATALNYVIFIHATLDIAQFRGYSNPFNNNAFCHIAKRKIPKFAFLTDTEIMQGIPLIRTRINATQIKGSWGKHSYKARQSMNKKLDAP